MTGSATGELFYTSYSGTSLFMASTKLNLNSMARLRILVNGIVQGVGFRPFVYNLAYSLQLTGFVSNSNDGVLIEIEGPESNLQKFQQRLKSKAPPLSDITDIRTEYIRILHSSKFEIQLSTSGNDNQTLISPDICTCEDCLKELFNPDDRRYLYPFINCTNCGPRYTIIKTIPYDRPFTSMAEFEMCPSCQSEHDDPANRRFHAQPNACPDCGPYVWFENTNSEDVLYEGNDAIQHAVKQLIAGKIIAIKGLGGFHLAVAAKNESAVRRLRDRKNREEKPLAVMVENIKSAKRIVRLSEGESLLLMSPQRPIVLLKKRQEIDACEAVAPGNKRLGIMLPYTPLHFILFKILKELSGDENPMLVMTSANLSEEPIAMTNTDARETLSQIADGYLMHNRDILTRADDSVMIELNGHPMFLRRSRGFVPRPVFLKNAGPAILAVGAELKNTICFLKNDRAFLSHHIGDLENLKANEFFTCSISYLQNILEIKPEAVVCDMHPGYFSRQWAKEQNELPVIEVQHHHAHLASVLAEWKLDEPVIGIILDGTGYGYDKTIWGGEILIGDFLQVKRYGWLQPMPLPGGDSAIKEPWKMALAYMYAIYGNGLTSLPFMEGKPVDLIKQMIDKSINTIQTSSCGRLFDAVAAMSGGKTSIQYEAQAAIEMMQSIESMDVNPFEFETQLPQIPLIPVIKSVIRSMLKGESFSLIAARFHKTLIELFTQVALSAKKNSDISTIVLSGGVFQNEVLLEHLTTSLQTRGFKTLYNRQVPSNDGGIALGQAAIGQKLMASGAKNVKFESN
jgi:hydrogenase maturation protein HypF